MAERHRMERVDGSGCGKKEKGDAKDSFWSGQGKSTRTGSIQVTPSLLDKVWKDGQKMGRIPFVDLDFTVGESDVRRPRYWVLIPGPVFQILKHKLTEDEFRMLKP